MLQWHEQGYAATAIADELRVRFPDAYPHVNTVYAELKRHAPDASGAWTLDDDTFSHAEARLVAEELRAVFGLTEGQTYTFTTRVARWVARLRSVRPELPPGTAHYMAQMHVYREGQGGPQVGAWWDVTYDPEGELATFEKAMKEHDE